MRRRALLKTAAFATCGMVAVGAHLAGVGVPGTPVATTPVAVTAPAAPAPPATATGEPTLNGRPGQNGSYPAVAEPARTPGAPFFGVFDQGAPWDMSGLQDAAAQVHCRARVIQVFQQVEDPFDVVALRKVAREHATPMLSLEPWHGRFDPAVPDPANTLRSVIDGHWDTQLAAVAASVAQFRSPVYLRYAHEMNGTWYPWAEGVNGNQPGEYVQAWRHVVDLFRARGATNAVWVWSPNIVDAAATVPLARLYPGDSYVDLMGVTGYGSPGQLTAGQTFDPSMAALRALAHKPVVLTEAGAQPGPHKAAWLASAGPWLAQQGDVVGAVWFNATGSGIDWRFTDTPEHAAALAASLQAAHVPCS